MISTNDQISSVPEFRGPVEKGSQPVRKYHSRWKKYIYIKHNPGRSQEIHESTNENMIETEVILELVKLITLVL